MCQNILCNPAVFRGTYHPSLHSRFSKNLMTNLQKTYGKVWLTKNLGWACDYQKILPKSNEKLRRRYAKLTKNLQLLQVSYENINFAASDVIWETLCQKLLLFEYFELKITDNQSDDFLRMLSKMTYHFPKKILGSHISLTYKRLHENLTTNIGKFLQKCERCSDIWGWLSNSWCYCKKEKQGTCIWQWTLSRVRYC